MLIAADICALLVSMYIYYTKDHQKSQQSLANVTCMKCMRPASRIALRPNCGRITMVSWLVFAFFLFVFVFFAFVVFGDSQTGV